MLIRFFIVVATGQNLLQFFHSKRKKQRVRNKEQWMAVDFTQSKIRTAAGAKELCALGGNDLAIFA